MPLTNFIPGRHGFHFVNTFVNHPFNGVPILGSIESFGLCGGMSLAALRYYVSGIPIPNHIPADFAPIDVPAEGSRLYNYLYDRQMESYGPFGLASSIAWRTMPWVTLDMQFRWSFTDVDCDFNKIKNSIGIDMPVIIGLRPSSGFSSLHTVLAIGYDENPRRVYVYDSNHPDTIMELRADNAAQRITYQARDAAPGNQDWASFFLTGAQAVGPRPTYIDLELQHGVDIITTSSPARFGEQATIAATVHNFGDNSVRIRRFILAMTNPSGATVELFTSNVSGPIQPGDDRQIICTIPKLGTAQGSHAIFARYETNQGHIIDLPAIAGSRNPVTIYLRNKITKSPRGCSSIKAKINKQLAIISAIADAGIPSGRAGATTRLQLLKAKAELERLRKESEALGCAP